ncbi:hypothetical protein PCE1_004135 [Barthelona sp. PCE]
MIELSSFDAVIFDMDGTLADSMGIWVEIDKKFIVDRGLAYPEGFQDKIHGLSFYECADLFINTFNLPDTHEELMKIWHDMAIDFYHEVVELKPGAMEFLQYLNNHGKKIAIASSAVPAMIQATIDRHNLSGLIPAFASSSDVKRGKPHPDVFLLAAERINVAPERCIAFEDNFAGCQASISAGMRVFGIEDATSAQFADQIKEVTISLLPDFKGIENQFE